MTDGEAGHERGAEGGGFEHWRDLDRALRRVGERLDERRVLGHAAVDAQRGDRDAGVGFGRLDEIGAALRDAFEHGADDVRACRAAGQPEQRAARAVVPHGGAEAEQRGNEHDAVGVGNGSREVVGLRAGVDDLQIVAEPLHAGSRGEHDRFDAVRRGAVFPPRDDREGAVPAPFGERGWGGPEREIEHGAGAERDLGVPVVHAALADERRLLVAENGRDRGRAGKRGCRRDHAGGVDDRRHQSFGDTELFEGLRFPVGVIARALQSRDGGVGGIGDVRAARS